MNISEALHPRRQKLRLIVDVEVGPRADHDPRDIMYYASGMEGLGDAVEESIAYQLRSDERVTCYMITKGEPT